MLKQIWTFLQMKTDADSKVQVKSQVHNSEETGIAAAVVFAGTALRTAEVCRKNRRGFQLVYQELRELIFKSSSVSLGHSSWPNKNYHQNILLCLYPQSITDARGNAYF